MRAPEASAYTGDRIALQRLLGTVRAGLGADCPILNELDVTGFADGDPVFQAAITADDGWRLPTGVGRILAENPLPPLARETARCDYNRDNPFAGCWVTVAPETAGGTILNIKNDGTWYWDTPEKLALGEPGLNGTEIRQDYMYLAGPYLTFVQKNGLAANMIGPYFGWDCDVLKINPYDPGGLATLMGMSYGITEPNIFVRLHSPQWINADILKTTDDNFEDGYNGNAGDDEIVESLPDEGPLFNNCVDNFDQDITDQMMLDIALLIIPAVRIPSLVTERSLARINLTARLFPKKYHPAIRVGVDRLPARTLGRGEAKLLRYSQGLQTSRKGLFRNVVQGKHGDTDTKYLWTIDRRGVNIALERTPAETERGHIVHTNISSKAAIGGEAWFTGDRNVIINAGSGRFGDGAGVTQTQWQAAQDYWRELGYQVTALPLGTR